MKQTKDYSNVGIEADGDLIFTTVAKYKLFLSYGTIGSDAYLLYSHLMFTARLQKTNQVMAKDMYIRQGLGWGAKRLLKAKKLLIQLGLIEKIQKFKENGDFDGQYIKVKTKTTPFEIESVEENSATLESATRQTRSTLSSNKCFNEKDKCFNEEVNTAQLSVFNKIWDKYQKKVGKTVAYKSFLKIKESEYDNILAHIDDYVKASPDKKYRKNLSTYLNQESWKDEIIDTSSSTNSFYDKEQARADKEFEELRRKYENKN